MHAENICVINQCLPHLTVILISVLVFIFWMIQTTTWSGHERAPKSINVYSRQVLETLNAILLNDRRKKVIEMSKAHVIQTGHFIVRSWNDFTQAIKKESGNSRSFHLTQVARRSSYRCPRRLIGTSIGCNDSGNLYSWR